MSTLAATLTRAQNTEKRNRKIRDAFAARYTRQPRPRKHSREYVVAEFFVNSTFSSGSHPLSNYI